MSEVVDIRKLCHAASTYCELLRQVGTLSETFYTPPPCNAPTVCCTRCGLLEGRSKSRNEELRD